jgi:hypothetical protein
LKYEKLPWNALVPLFSARLTEAPAVWPACASKALVWTLNSAIASEGGEKPTTPLLLPGFVLLGDTRLGAPSRVKSLPPSAPLATMLDRPELSIGREKWRSDASATPGARRASMYAVPSPRGSCWI